MTTFRAPGTLVVSGTLVPGTTPADPATAAHDAAVEQVMRTCDDDLSVLEVFTASPGSAAAAAVLGRFLHRHPVRLLAGCPLIGWVSGAPVDPQWRRAYPPRPHSLYEQLELLSVLYARDTDLPPGPDRHAQLEALRLRGGQILD